MVSSDLLSFGTDLHGITIAANQRSNEGSQPNAGDKIRGTSVEPPSTSG